MKALKEKQHAENRARSEKRGIVIVNTGDGKGKSTAAFGLILRHLGHEKRVAVVQFIKGTWKTGEGRFFAEQPLIDHVVSGEGFTWNTQDRERDIAAARRGLDAAREMIERCRGETPRYALIVLDEINIALRYGYLDAEEVAAMLRDKPRELTIVATGRDAPEALIEVADTVTRMDAVKHAAEAGIRARVGVEF